MAKFYQRRDLLRLGVVGCVLASVPKIASAATIADLTARYDQLSEWRRLTALVGIDKTLAKIGPYTAFLPTNLAFEYLSDGAKAELNMKNNTENLKRVLNYHIVQNTLYLENLAGRVTQTPTLAGRELTINGTGPRPKIEEATFIRADIKADNGIVHIIDAVLWPRI